MAVSEEILFGVRSPWRTDPIEFITKPGCDIVRGSSPGFYEYAADGVVSSKQVDAVQLIEWGMARLIESDLFKPSKKFEFTGNGMAICDFVDGTDGYLIQDGEKIAVVNQYYLLANKIAKPGAALLSEAKRKVISEYEPADKPWFDDEIKFTAGDGVVITKGADKGKYRVQRYGAIVTYSAAKLINMGLAVKDDCMYDGYFASKATRIDWQKKKKKAFYDLIPDYLLTCYGYTDNDGEPGSLFEAALSVIRAAKQSGKEVVSVVGWASGIVDKDFSDAQSKSELTEAISKTASMLEKTAEAWLDNAEETGAATVKILALSKVDGKLDFVKFFDLAMRVPRAGCEYESTIKVDKSKISSNTGRSDFEAEKRIKYVKNCKDVPLVRLFEDDRLDAIYANAKELDERINELEGYIAAVKNLVSKSAMLVSKRQTDPTFEKCCAFLDKSPATVETSGVNKSACSKSCDRAEENLEKIKNTRAFAEEFVKLYDMLADKANVYNQLYAIASGMAKRKFRPWFFKIRRVFPSRLRSIEYSDYKLYYLRKKGFVIHRHGAGTCTVDGYEFNIPEGRCYDVIDKKTKAVYGILSEEALVYCGLAMWRN